MRFVGPDQVAAALPWPSLIEAIEKIMVTPQAHAPERTAHSIPHPDGSDAALLMKPGWVVGDVIAVKLVTFYPDNGALNLPTVNAGVVLFDATNGTLLGACDGNELTTRRTAAASAVAAKRLARADARRLLVVGTGALAPMTAQAHAAVRPYDRIDVWGRRPEAARQAVDVLVADGYPAHVADDVSQAVATADVITCVTGSNQPIVLGADVSPGTHIDLIGSFTPEMRETDDEVIRMAQVWVDTRTDGVLAGDLAQPLASGVLRAEDIQGDLAELIAGTCATRASDDQVTLFKSAGTALEDVAAARLVFDTK